VLFAGRKKFHKIVRGRAKITNASARRQRAYVKKNARGPTKLHIPLLPACTLRQNGSQQAYNPV
jgi:hypothetical protein